MEQWCEAEELDDLDPMAVPTAVRARRAADDSVEDSADDGAAEGGYADSRYKVLRVWLDEEGLISQVRLLGSWPDKLKNTPLSVPFEDIFSQIQRDLRPVPDPQVLEDPERPASEQPLGWTAMRDVVERFESVRDQVDALGPEDEDRWEGHPSSGRSADGLVTIELDEHGLLHGIHFDEELLEEAMVKEITKAVVQAHAAAREAQEPGRIVPGERTRLRAQLRQTRQELLSMMKRGAF